MIIDSIEYLKYPLYSGHSLKCFAFITLLIPHKRRWGYYLIWQMTKQARRGQITCPQLQREKVTRSVFKSRGSGYRALLHPAIHLLQYGLEPARPLLSEGQRALPCSRAVRCSGCPPRASGLPLVTSALALALEILNCVGVGRLWPELWHGHCGHAEPVLTASE